MVDFTGRVAAGVAFLDEQAPEGWRRLITSDPDRLAMTDPHNCVLGIVFGDFWTACREFSEVDAESETYFAEMHDWASAYGFTVHDDDNAIDDDDPDADGAEAWDELDAEWRAALDIS